MDNTSGADDLRKQPVDLAKIREMKAVIARKIADGEMSPEEGDRIFKALTSDAPIAATEARPLNEY
jgi:hypothetical protein